MFRLYSIAEWITLLCSFLLFTKGVERKYRIFFLYIFVVVIIEYFGRSIATELKVDNHLLFTFACFFFSLFYFYTLGVFIKDKRHRLIIRYFKYIFVLFYIINLLFFQQLVEFNSYSFIFGYLLIAISCTFFYIDYLNKDIITSFWQEPDFIIVSGYFAYSILTAILYTIHRYFAYLKIPDAHYREAFSKTNDIANVCLYFSLSIAFVLLWKKKSS